MIARNLPEGTQIIDLREGTNHPLSLLYSEIYSEAILNGELSAGRSQPGFSLKGHSPFYWAAKNALVDGQLAVGSERRIFNVLAEYYRCVQPKSAATWLGINLTSSNPLAKAPPWGAVFPWRARTQESYQQCYEKAAVAENMITSAPLGILDGWLFCGPVSTEKCRIEAKRIHYVLEQIATLGYQRSNESDGDVKATALVREDGHWRWLITAGNHRAVAASALGRVSIPVRINLVISRSQVEYWPHVVTGLYTREQALAVFDQFFDATPPPVTRLWMEWLDCQSDYAKSYD